MNFAAIKLRQRTRRFGTKFAEHFVYMSLDINNVDGFRELNNLTEELDAKFDIPATVCSI